MAAPLAVDTVLWPARAIRCELRCGKTRPDGNRTGHNSVTYTHYNYADDIANDVSVSRCKRVGDQDRLVDQLPREDQDLLS